MTSRRVALVHDWILGVRGGEKVLSVLAEMFPQAELFTLLADRDCFPPALRPLKLRTSWLNQLPGARHYYRQLLPFMTSAVERFDLSGYDLVISSSHCVAKGVRAPEGVPHLCYCHTPVRYAWQLRDLYLEQTPRWLRPMVRRELDRLREWDRQSADRVTRFVANGKTVQQRIRECYGRDSIIVHPPVDIDYFTPDSAVPREDFYLAVSALVPNKRIDLAVEACRQLGRRLVVIGTGPSMSKLRKLGGNVKWLGWQSDEVVRDYYRRCRALLFPGEEDFGMVPIEANACGVAVIAYGQGGATETIVPPEQSGSPTGRWFMEPVRESLAAAIERFEGMEKPIRPEDCRRKAEQFSRARFVREMDAVVASCQTNGLRG